MTLLIISGLRQFIYLLNSNCGRKFSQSPSHQVLLKVSHRQIPNFSRLSIRFPKQFKDIFSFMKFKDFSRLAFNSRPVQEPCPLSPLVLGPRTRPAGTQTEPQLEPATSAGVILPETGQFMLLCSLRLWQQLQCCRQTHARVPIFFDTFTSVLRKQVAVNMFLKETKQSKAKQSSNWAHAEASMPIK